VEFNRQGISGRLFARLDAVHSSGAEGSTTTFADLMEFAGKRHAVASPEEADEVAACAEAIGELAAARVEPIDAILHIHKRLFEKAPDLFKAASAGALKQRSNSTFDSDQPDGWFRYTAPASVGAALAEWQTFTMAFAPQVPELVRQSCSHWMFEHIHPVQDGNGRVGRLLVPLVLKWKDTTKMASAFVGEAVHENKDLYIDGLKNARLTGDMTPFVRLFLSFLKQTADQNTVRLGQLRILRNSWQSQIMRYRSTNVVHRALPWIISHPVFTVTMLAEDLQASFPAANSTAKILVELGIAQPATGDGRNRLFRVPAVLDIFDRFRKSV
jgi:Fic family protein